MLLLALAILPVIVLATYIYVKDRFQREPLPLLLLALFCGALTTIPILFVERFLQSVSPYEGLQGALYTAFVVAGCTEEAFKIGRAHV